MPARRCPSRHALFRSRPALAPPRRGATALRGRPSVLRRCVNDRRPSSTRDSTLCRHDALAQVMRAARRCPRLRAHADDGPGPDGARSQAGRRSIVVRRGASSRCRRRRQRVGAGGHEFSYRSVRDDLHEDQVPWVLTYARGVRRRSSRRGSVAIGSRDCGSTSGPESSTSRSWSSSVSTGRDRGNAFASPSGRGSCTAQRSISRHGDSVRLRESDPAAVSGCA